MDSIRIVFTQLLRNTIPADGLSPHYLNVCYIDELASVVARIPEALSCTWAYEENGENIGSLLFAEVNIAESVYYALLRIIIVWKAAECLS